MQHPTQDTPPVETQLYCAEEEELLDLANRSLSDATRRVYGILWRQFFSWAVGKKRCPLPATWQTVGVYLNERAKEGRRYRTLTLTLSAITKAHKAARVPTPCTRPELHAALHGIALRIGVVPNKKHALSVEELAIMADTFSGTDAKSLRNRAILLVAFQTALRRSELSSLRRMDVRAQEEGYLLYIVKSKTDQVGRGQTVPCFYTGTPLCPATALRRWLAASRLLGPEDPLFVCLTKEGALRHEAFSGAQIAYMFQTTSRAVDPALALKVAGHSTRAGCITAASLAGVPATEIMDLARHKRFETTLGYVRRANKMSNKTGLKIGL